jgi:4-hydroxy-tetrahydrodipicolinate synthase
LAAEGTARGIKDSQNDLEAFRQLTRYTRQRQIPFSAFAGTRFLIDAAILAGADGAIPSLANAFPDLCVAAYQAAAAGDYARSAELEARIIGIENVATRSVGGGSPNAAILGFLKAHLHRQGIIASSALSAPLRTPTEAEQDAMSRGVAELIEAAAV